MNKIGRKLSDFFCWWGEQLAFLVPEPLKQIFNDNKGKLIIQPDKDFVRAFFLLNGKKTEIGVFELNELGKTEFFSQAEKDSRLEKSDVVIRLSDQDAIEKITLLPAAAETEFRQVVSYELDKLTPFKSEQIYFDVRRLNHDSSGHLIKVQLIIALKDKLDSVCKEMRSWGLIPSIADFENVPNDFEHDRDIYNLLPDWARAQKNILTQVINYLVIGLLTLLFCAVFAVPVWREASAVQQLQDQIKVVGKEASKVETLRNEIQQLQEKTARLLAKKSASPLTVELIEELSKLIADDTWLKHLKYSSGRLQIQGQSPNASSLISVLEESSLFNSVKFVSPVTQDRRSGLERFQISAEINKGAKHVGATE